MDTGGTDHGSTTLGLDRAEVGDSPQVNENSFLPKSEPLPDSDASIRKTLRETWPRILLHPQGGIRKVKAVAKEKKVAQGSTEDGNVPMLAPAPLHATGEERLEHDLEPRRKFPPAKEFIEHPIAALKTVARDQGGDDFATNVMESEVSHGASVRLLRQEQKVLEANENNHEVEMNTLLQFKSARQDAFVRWTIDRHLRRVGVLPELPPQRRRPEDQGSWSQWTLYTGQRLQDDLVQFGQRHVQLTPSERAEPTRELLLSGLERVVIISASFQSFIMTLRDISHWTNPRKSAICMVLYFIFLFYSQVTRCAILLALLSVVYRRWNPPGLTELRNAVRHAENKDEEVNTLTELTLQYGTRGWVDHVVAQIGPSLLHQLEHTADLLERIQNLYEWRDPYYTRLLLGKLFAMWIVITFTPTWLLVQLSFFIMGVSFFIIEPIGFHYPRFELLVSPMNWLLWGIPTHAEWAIARLQAEAATNVGSESDEADSEDTSIPENAKGARVIGRYHCATGLFKVTTESVAFTSGTSSASEWLIMYNELSAIHKVDEQTRTKEVKGFEFLTASGQTRVVLELDLRDEIFSQILGYSKLRWKKVE